MIARHRRGDAAWPGEDAPPIIVNDALRRPPSDQLITALAPVVRERIIGLSPLASTGAPDEPPGPYAVNAFDCMNLIALAAAQAGSDDPAAIAAQISDVSEGGVSCRLFAECIALVAVRAQRRLRRPGRPAADRHRRRPGPGPVRPLGLERRRPRPIAVVGPLAVG